jgi:hypothetical protein
MKFKDFVLLMLEIITNQLRQTNVYRLFTAHHNLHANFATAALQKHGR